MKKVTMMLEHPSCEHRPIEYVVNETDGVDVYDTTMFLHGKIAAKDISPYLYDVILHGQKFRIRSISFLGNDE